MLHAKTAITDGRWARVGSTNLNIASWFGNCELDAVIEDESFAHAMEEMYLDDLTHATEIVLDARRKVRVPGEPRRPFPHMKRDRDQTSRVGRVGRTGRVAAGAMRIGNVLGAAFTNRRVLEPIEARITVVAGIFLMLVAVLLAFFPRLFVYPLAAILVWIALALLYRGYRLHRRRKKRTRR